MKKKIVTILVFIFICQVGFCQKNVSQLFNDFSQHEHMTKVKIGKIAMTFAGLFGDTMGVDRIEILEFGNCAEHVKIQFKEAVRTLKDPSFDTLVNTSENGNRTKVMVKIENDTIHELVVLTSGSDAALIRIKGKIKKSDIERLVNKHS